MELCFKQLALPGEAFIWDQHNIVYLHNGISWRQGAKRRNRQIDKKDRIKGNLHLDKIFSKLKLLIFHLKFLFGIILATEDSGG